MMIFVCECSGWKPLMPCRTPYRTSYRTKMPKTLEIPCVTAYLVAGSRWCTPRLPIRPKSIVENRSVNNYYYPEDSYPQGKYLESNYPEDNSLKNGYLELFL